MKGPKNASPVGRELVSAMPNDDAHNKNASEVCSVIVLAWEKDSDSGLFAPVMG
jgi:hypothetical protein